MARTVALPAAGARQGAPAWLLVVARLAAVVILALGAYLLLRALGGEVTSRAITVAVEATATTAATPAAPTAVTATESLLEVAAIATTQMPTSTAAATERPSATATPADWRVLILPDGIESAQVLVPAGSFMMGADDEDSDDDEAPIHEVRLGAFWLDVTEVTNAQYAAFMADSGYVTADEIDGAGYTVLTGNFENVSGANWRHPQGPGSDIVGQDDHPVTMVSWDDSRAYCAWAGGRLPTESQWEYAARGPQATTYPWGDLFSDERVNSCDRNCPMDWANDDTDDGYVFAAAVGTFGGGQSWVGAEDMAGNVWEWTADWYDKNYYARSPVANPTGPGGSVDEDGKSVRGGAWSSTIQGVRSAVRVSVGAWRGHFDVGFRCVYPAAGSVVP